MSVSGEAVSPSVTAVDLTPLTGLTEQQAAERREQGLGNHARHETARTYREIIRDNLFTFINITLIAIGLILIAMGQLKDAILSSGLVVINAAVGILQESIAKRRLDQIALLAQSQATVIRDGQERTIDPGEIVLGDILRVESGNQIMVDGELVGGGAIEVDESLLTGETDSVKKQTGDAVYSGSFCVSGSALYQAVKVGSDTMASNIAAGAKAYRLVLTPLQRDVNMIVRVLLLIAGLMLSMILMGSAIWEYSFRDTVVSAAIVLGIVPSGLFLMITVTYSLAAVRLANQNALIQQMNAVESLSNVDVFCMDKTGTLTANKLVLTELQPIDGYAGDLERDLGNFSRSASGGTKTSEAIADACGGEKIALYDEIPFSSARKWSAVAADAEDWQGVFALGAPEMLGRRLAHSAGGPPEGWADRGLRVLLFARSETAKKLHDPASDVELPRDIEPVAWLGFSDELRPNSREALSGFRDAGIDLKIISGDNPETVASLARQAGLPADAKLFSGIELEEMTPAEFNQAADEGTVFGRITPEQKERLVEALRRRGRYVAMTGDGVNDVLSLKKADLGIAMQSGSQATRAAADIILIGDTFSALPAAFQEGKRIRRGLQGVLALFLTRVTVVALVIAMTSAIQAAFPFSPGHMTLLTILTVGIPTFGLALWAHPGDPPANLIRSLLAFVLPAGFLLSIAAFLIYVLLYFTHDVDLPALRGDRIGNPPAVDNQIARDALTYLLVLAGLWLVVFAAPPTRWFAVVDELAGDWRPTILAIAMIPLYIVIMIVNPLREFFGLHSMSAGAYISIGLVVLIWVAGLRYVWKTHAFERFFGFAVPEEGPAG
jgi:cation-transporting ATPase E